MEAAGLVIGVVALAGTFKDCVDLFSYFLSYRTLGRDYEILEAKLDVEKTLLLQWARRVRLLHPDHDLRLEDATTQNAVSRVLVSICRLLGESSALQERYGLKPVQPATGSADVRATTVSRGPMERFIKDFKALQVRMEDKQLGVAKTAKIRWAINDKDKFEKLVQELSHFVSKLNDSFPTPTRTVSIIRSATINAPEHVAKPAEARFEEVLRPKLLERIWFRTMDDRLEAVAPAHRGTFSWALHPPSDLSPWLTSGSGIFWLSGKAGSGKSTLMKYLYGYKDTRSQLSNWAGASLLILGSFFSWNIGASEQKSHTGLSRAILYQVLAHNLPLISTLLPRMWQEARSYEAHLDDLSGLDPPSPGELATAFQRLLNAEVRQRFCFFIDGLDEYEGNPLDGIAFVQNLCLNPNIKMLLSSRPIPLCVDAFSSLPTLRLQDLTRTDIENYVHDTLGSHKYLATLKASNPASAEMVLQQLIDKSAGVFLWVLLACRSVISGFAAYDTIAELIRRVDELPPELEGMFRHMLRMVESRYFKHTAKMLRICYQRQVTNRALKGHWNGTPDIRALPWHILDGVAMDFENAPPFDPSPLDQECAIWERVEGRLRSRCGGLLEVRRVSKPIEDRASIKDLTMDSTVEFMHRTVFEFLDNPEIWNLDYLRIHDERFNANAALLKRDSSWPDSMADALLCARLADEENPHLSFSLLERMAIVIHDEELRALLREDSMRPSELIGQYGLDSFLLALGVEANMVKYVSHHLPRHESRPLGYPLLYHALGKVLLCGSSPSPSDTEYMIHRLLSDGYQPNEEFSKEDGVTTTPWMHWVSRLVKMSRGDFFKNLAITEELIEMGASSDEDQSVEIFLMGLIESTHGKTSERGKGERGEALRVLNLLGRKRQHRATERPQSMVRRFLPGFPALLRRMPSLR
ncbi:prion-inhibition and propagation-domain-containing protein [Ilyonectria destructans]|nr:prion-inhibition and propagation-domain-containing protein [Ilyonectria destructans]